VVRPTARRPEAGGVDYHLPLVEQGDWQNDADYPRAPLPAHERSWRHPSEIGAEQWVQSEPPLVVGRGLSVATGTVGAVLALGLLWLMVPHPGRDSGVAIGSSTTALRTTVVAIATPLLRDIVTSTADAEASTIGVPTTAPAGTTDASVTPSVTPSTTSALTVAPMPTMVLDGNTTITDSMPPIAVALVPGHFVVTTAAAVRGREGFAVMLPSGDTVVGAVVLVDVANGTAVLWVGTDIDAAMIPPSTIGDTIGDTTGNTTGNFVVMNPDATAASLWVDDSGTWVGYDVGVHPGEGTVVLDDHGALVGLCTRSATGMQLVTVNRLLDALALASALETPAWLGVEYDLDSVGNVIVTRVLEDGPGQAAGIRVGDVITAIDGVSIADLETLRKVVGSHAAGESVTLTVSQVPAAQTTTTAAGATTVPATGASVANTGGSSTNATTISSAGATTNAVASTTTQATPTTTTTTTTTNSTTTNSTTAITVDIRVTLAPAPGSS